MKNLESNRNTHPSLYSSPKPSNLLSTPPSSPYSKFLLNCLSPISFQSPPRSHQLFTPKTKSIFPVNLADSLDYVSPIKPDRSTSKKSLTKIDLLALAKPNSVKFSSVSAKIILVQEPEEKLTQVRAGKRQRNEPNHDKKICCNCQKSRCLKLYCDCFAAGVYCKGCNCLDCFNTQCHEGDRREAVAATLDRNPDAFRPKIKTVSMKGETQSVHNKGCHCSKSGCLKKYCECFQSGIGCTENCQCVGCKNIATVKKSEEKKKQVCVIKW